MTSAGTQVAAFGFLKSFAERCIGEIPETAHVSLALLRLPAVTDFLLSLVIDPSPAVAENALKAWPFIVTTRVYANERQTPALIHALVDAVRFFLPPPQGGRENQTESTGSCPRH